MRLFDDSLGVILDKLLNILDAMTLVCRCYNVRLKWLIFAETISASVDQSGSYIFWIMHNVSAKFISNITI